MCRGIEVRGTFSKGSQNDFSQGKNGENLLYSRKSKKTTFFAENVIRGQGLLPPLPTPMRTGSHGPGFMPHTKPYVQYSMSQLLQKLATLLSCSAQLHNFSSQSRRLCGGAWPDMIPKVEVKTYMCQVYGHVRALHISSVLSVLSRMWVIPNILKNRLYVKKHHVLIG